MRIVDQNEMQEIEKVTFSEYKLTEATIIENVGSILAHKIEKQVLKEVSDFSLVFLIGRGNNGADGLALARYLTNAGYNVRAFVLAEDGKTSSEMKRQMEIAELFGVKVSPLEKVETLNSYFYQNMSKHIIVDAILGTGARLPLSDFLYDVINSINENSSYTISIDLPTGVDTNTGNVIGNAVKADLVYSIGFPKVGCYISNGAEYTGSLININVGFPQVLEDQGNKYLTTEDDVIETAAQRNRFADKKIFGHTLVLGGSHGLTGALVLASQSALKVGTGLVTGATWEPQYQEFISRLIPEVMTGYIPTDETKWDKVLSGLNRYDSIVIGPGLGVSARSRRAVHAILSHYQGPVVVDADAINVLNLNEDANLLQSRSGLTVLTPHYGEMARLVEKDREEVFKEPLKYLSEVVERTNATVILKGPCSFLGLPSGDTFFNYFPNSGMATGGVGDVLAGILGGLLAQDS
ncbi:MAG: NAD(P)H-hydrate dehydratase, partial [Halobacteriovoraceae bacterium]|nr:NAD(P)H-hydrate dehydratase [Halobacteriovoraceae bacterium]